MCDCPPPSLLPLFWEELPNIECLEVGGSSIVPLSQKLRELDPPSTDQWASAARSPTVISPAGWPSGITCILVHCPYKSSCFH